MRCPNCGRMIPEPRYSRNDPMMIYAVCKRCGRIIMPYTTTLSRDNADIGHKDAIIGQL